MDMTMKELRSLCKEKDFLEAVNHVVDMVDDLCSEEVLKQVAKDAIDRDELLLAAHLCKGMWDEGASSDAFYKWDSTAGTMCPVRGINDGQELYEAYVDYCSDYTTANAVLNYFNDDDEDEEEY